MSLKYRVEAALVERRVVVSGIQDKIRRAESAAKKEQRQVPRSEMEALQSELRDAKANVFSQEAALCGVLRYPPL